MEFGYFTLSDDHYENNKRTSNHLVADITDGINEWSGQMATVLD
jgi:hypothetical protein